MAIYNATVYNQDKDGPDFDRVLNDMIKKKQSWYGQESLKQGATRSDGIYTPEILLSWGTEIIIYQPEASIGLFHSLHV